MPVGLRHPNYKRSYILLLRVGQTCPDKMTYGHVDPGEAKRRVPTDHKIDLLVGYGAVLREKTESA